MRRLHALIVTLLLGLATPAAADQRDPTLDGLFGQLQVAEGPHSARMIEGAIWQVWLKHSSATVDLLMKRSLEAMSKGDYDASLEILDTVVELDPEYAEGWNKRATVYYLLGRFPESIGDVEKTLALEPRHFGALSGLGLIYSALEKDQEALDAYERALAVNPHLMQARHAVRLLKKRVRGDKI